MGEQADHAYNRLYLFGKAREQRLWITGLAGGKKPLLLAEKST